MADRSRFWVLVEHPRTALIGALVATGLGIVVPGAAAFVLFGVAGLLVLRSAWEWAPIRGHVPFGFQSPIVRLTPRAPKPAAPELGRIDHELRVVRAGESGAVVLGKMAKEMEANTARLNKRTAEMVRLQGASIQRRHRAMEQTGREISGHAKRMAKLEANYRTDVETLVTSARRWIEGASPGEDMGPVVSTAAELRAVTFGSRQGTEGYRQSVQAGRDANTSQVLNGAYEELLPVLERIVEDTDLLIDYCDWVADLAQQGISQTVPPPNPPAAPAP